MAIRTGFAENGIFAVGCKTLFQQDVSVFDDAELFKRVYNFVHTFPSENRLHYQYIPKASINYRNNLSFLPHIV